MTIWTLIGWAIGAAVVAAPVYWFVCWMWPFTDCRRCKGFGRFASPSGKYRRRCRKCKGSGERVRTGRRIWTWLAGKTHDAVG
jgi:hypothetical protein